MSLSAIIHIGGDRLFCQAQENVNTDPMLIIESGPMYTE